MITNEQQKIVEENINLVYFVVHKYFVPEEDYYSIGMIGLIKGVKNYDKSRGSSLSTYLVSCIKNEIAYHYRNNKNPKDVLSIDAANNDGDTSLLDAISDETNIEEYLIEKEKHDNLYKAISKLNKVEQYIIVNYYGLKGNKKKMLKEIAYDLGMKPNKMTKLHIKALKKLRKYLEEGKI